MANIFTRGGLLLVAPALLSTVAAAGPIQKFDFQGAGGTISYTESIPTGSPALGSPFLANGGISKLSRASGTPFTVAGGAVSITTGGCNVGKNCYTPNGSDSLQLGFADSSTTGIKITGGINFTNPLFDIPAGSTLLTGELTETGATIRGPHAPTGKDTGGLNAEILASFINIDLLKGLGLLPANSSNPTKSIEQLDFMLTGNFTFTPGQTVLGNILLTDISITPTPEPADLLLFGSTLLIAAGFMRRRLIAR
jgi:hypothetical protein